MSHDVAPTRRMPALDGRAPRIVLLVFRDADTDSRVLKSAASLREAGAEVLIIGVAPYRSALSPGDALTPDGLALHRTVDLDLVVTFAGPVRAWRRLKSWKPVAGSSPSPSPTPSAPQAPPSPQRRPGGPKARLTDAYMRGYRTVRLVKYWAGAVAAARRFEPDVVHANDGNTLAPALILRALTRSRIVYDSHELWLRRNVRADRWLAPLVEAVIERWGVRAADAVITVSPSIAAWLTDRYQLTEPPILVRNVPVWHGAPSPEQGRLRTLAGLGANDRVVSYCGGITTGRGLEETVDALAVLPDDVHLVVLGFGAPAYCTELVGRARDRGVAERVHLVGHVPVPDVAKALADADLAVVYVRPIVLSYLYCLPNKLFESVHAGLPIVAADLPDCASFVRQHGIGEVFADGTPEDLAAAIAAVLARAPEYRAAALALAPSLNWRLEADGLIEAHNRAVQRLRP